MERPTISRKDWLRGRFACYRCSIQDWSDALRILVCRTCSSIQDLSGVLRILVCLTCSTKFRVGICVVVHVCNRNCDAGKCTKVLRDMFGIQRYVFRARTADVTLYVRYVKHVTDVLGRSRSSSLEMKIRISCLESSQNENENNRALRSIFQMKN